MGRSPKVPINQQEGSLKPNAGLDRKSRHRGAAVQQYFQAVDRLVAHLGSGGKGLASTRAFELDRTDRVKELQLKKK